jgi:integrase
MASQLGQGLVLPSTFQDYSRSIERFYKWINRKYSKSVKGSHAMDIALTKYFHYLYDRGYGVSRAISLFSAILFFFPQYHHKLNVSYQAWKGWKRMEPSIHKPALSWELTVLIAATAARDYGIQYALIILLSFDCYLRPREATLLQCDDISFIRKSNSDYQINNDFSIAIRIKKGKRDQNATLYINNPSIAKLIYRYYRHCHGLTSSVNYFFGISYSNYLRVFKEIISVMDLPSSIKPHSMRHSGVTHDYMHGTEFARLRERGRWASDNTLRSYLNISIALVNDLQAPSNYLQAGAQLSKILYSFFSHFINLM